MTERIDVNRLKVASPCPTTWDSMQGDERVRFCNLCQKNVYNLEQLTQAQIEQIISENENGFCGRLAMREDGTVITNDCPVGLRRLRERWQRLCVAVSSLVAMFLGAPTSAGEKKSSEEAKQNSHIPTQAISLPTQYRRTVGLIPPPPPIPPLITAPQSGPVFLNIHQHRLTGLIFADTFTIEGNPANQEAYRDMDSPEKRWQNWFRIFGQELFNRWIATAPKNGHLTSTVTIDHANHVSVSLTGHGTEPDKDFKGSIQHAITEASWATPMPSRTTGPSFKSIKFEIIFSASDESFPDVITRGPGYAVWYDKDGTLHQSKGKHTPEITSDVEIIDSPSIPAQELFNAIQKTGI